MNAIITAFTSDTYINPTETGFYYLNSRYYDPEVGRFLNADSGISGVGGELLGYNMYAYCFNNPVNMSDPTGNWPKWIAGALNIVSGMAQMAVGAALGATVGWTGLGAVAAGFLIANGAATATQGVGQIVNDVTKSNIMREDNIVRTGVKSIGKTVGGKTGEKIAGTAYDAAVIAANIYAGSATKTSSACFIAGTAVLTATGYSAIEDICIGDKVWSGNPENGAKELKEVIQTFVTETDELVHVYVNGEEIITTPEHPFYVAKKGWVGALDLRAGDILVLQSGEYVTVEMIQHEILESPVAVYNLEVEDFHTYYVSNSAVLVHNKCVVKQNGVKVEVRTSNEHGLPHGHVSGNGPNTTIGLNQMPMKNHPDFSKKQLKVIQENWEVIQNGIIELFPKR